MLLAAFFHVPRQNGPLRTTEFLIVFPLATHPEQRFCRLFKEIAYLDEVIQTIFSPASSRSLATSEIDKISHPGSENGRRARSRRSNISTGIRIDRTEPRSFGPGDALGTLC